MTADAGFSYPVEFKNFLKTTFSQNTSGGLLQLDLGLVKVFNKKQSSVFAELHLRKSGPPNSKISQKEIFWKF